MNKKTRLAAIIIVLLAIFVGGFFYFLKSKKAIAPVEMEEQAASAFIDQKEKTEEAEEPRESSTKGWLEKTEQGWRLAETTSLLYEYSGRKFNLKISDATACLYFSNEENFKESKCTNENSLFKWGSGDRVRIYGNINGDNINVYKMEIVSALPINSW